MLSARPFRGWIACVFALVALFVGHLSQFSTVASAPPASWEGSSSATASNKKVLWQRCCRGRAGAALLMRASSTRRVGVRQALDNLRDELDRERQAKALMERRWQSAEALLKDFEHLQAGPALL